jgi:hypothetical protein
MQKDAAPKVKEGLPEKKEEKQMRRTIVLLTTMEMMIKNLSHLRVVLAAAAAGVFLAVAMLVLVAENPAEAAFPGRNGKIAWVSGNSNYLHIYTRNVDGTGYDRVTAGTRKDILPAWSPDGTMIAFSSKRDGDGDYEIYTMNAANGTGVVRFTNNPASIDMQPAWQRLSARPGSPPGINAPCNAGVAPPG